MVVERKEKSPEQISDEDYKVAPTSVDREVVASNQPAVESKKEEQEGAMGSSRKTLDVTLQEELREGVE